MSVVSLGGHGFWTPVVPGYLGTSPVLGSSDTMLLDADEEEAQFIGQVTIDGGGTKTFGTSSKVGWLVGAATIAFAAGSTLRIGIKQASRLDTAAGPPARATLGAAAFDVYDDLVGGTDTLTALAWREETMTAGTPFTVNHGDFLAVCFHLDVASGTPTVKIRGPNVLSTLNFPVSTLVTAGPTYTAGSVGANLILSFDDGTLGWLEPSKVFSVVEATTSGIGNGNTWGNLLQVPYACQIDALGAYLAAGAGTSFALELYSSPLASPVLIDSLTHDTHILASASGRFLARLLPTPRSLSANTPYAVSVKQLNATSVFLSQWDVSNADYFKPSGMGAQCYAVNKTGAGNFVAQITGRRRYLVWMRIAAIDDGGAAASGGGGSVFGAAGGVIS